MNPTDFENENHSLIRYHGSEPHVSIPEGIEKIAYKAFANCHTLESVSIPESVTSIDRVAFFDCRNLKTIEIPASVREIGDEIFECCYHLTEVILHEGLVSIGGLAFAHCKNLEQIKIPESVSFMGDLAFLGCDAMKPRPLMLLDGNWFYRPENSDDIPDFRMKDLIREKNYTARLDSEIKYDLLFQMFLYDLDQENFSAYLKKKFPDMFRYLIRKENIRCIQKILDSGGFITQRNIDKFIQYAIENQKTQVQILLINYKYQHFDFKQIGEELKL